MSPLVSWGGPVLVLYMLTALISDPLSLWAARLAGVHACHLLSCDPFSLLSRVIKG